jgi:hypothetical protein
MISMTNTFLNKNYQHHDYNITTTFMLFVDIASTMIHQIKSSFYIYIYIGSITLDHMVFEPNPTE